MRRLVSGRKAVQDAGHPERLVDSSLMAVQVVVSPFTTNTTVVYVGGAETRALASGEAGQPLVTDGTSSSRATLENIDLVHILIDSRTDAEGVTWLAIVDE